jgi:hypothetical protein
MKWILRNQVMAKQRLNESKPYEVSNGNLSDGTPPITSPCEIDSHERRPSMNWLDYIRLRFETIL